MTSTEGAVDVNIDRDSGETFVNSAQYECTYIKMLKNAQKRTQRCLLGEGF